MPGPDQDRERRQRQPWKAAYEQDFAWLNGVIVKHYHGDDADLRVLAAGVLQAFEGVSVEEFEAQAASFLYGAQHPTLGRPYRACGSGAATKCPMSRGAAERYEAQLAGLAAGSSWISTLAWSLPSPY